MSDNNHTGILLINLGTPDEPTASAVRRYLKEFLSDRRVVDIPRWLWWPILNGIILRVRPLKVAKLYQSIWLENDSPLRAILSSQGEKLASVLKVRGEDDDRPIESKHSLAVKVAMTYGNPSVNSVIQQLVAENCHKIVVLPLFPQYSATSTGAAFDVVAKAMMRQRNLPELIFIKDYHLHPQYIDAVRRSIEEFWENNGRSEHLIFSFHGIPQRYYEAGDPYPDQCAATAKEIASALKLEQSQWTYAYQSRFGREPWVKPYLDSVLVDLAQKKSVDVVCPSFSADCLETLEEIKVQLKQVFIEAGGEKFQYIPALNDREDHIQLMATLIEERLFS